MSMMTAAGLGVLRGTRPLLSSAAASSKFGRPKKGASASEGRKTNGGGFGIQKASPVSPALANFLDCSSASRVEAVKKIWSYIKLHNLQNPTNKREINCDDKLKSIVQGKDKVGFLEMGKLLSPHFKTD